MFNYFNAIVTWLIAKNAYILLLYSYEFDMAKVFFANPRTYRCITTDYLSWKSSGKKIIEYPYLLLKNPIYHPHINCVKRSYPEGNRYLLNSDYSSGNLGSNHSHAPIIYRGLIYIDHLDPSNAIK